MFVQEDHKKVLQKNHEKILNGPLLEEKKNAYYLLWIS